MTVKRIRTLRATIGAATAVALAMGLAGCQPAHFDPNNPTAGGNANPAQTGTTTTPVTNTNTGTGTGTGVTTPTTAAMKPMVIKGLVSLAAGPMPNASMKVVDAISGKPLGIIAAGAGNIIAGGAGNYRAKRHLHQAPTATAVSKAAALVKTDGAGQFKLAVLGLAPGKVARIIATANGKTVTCLITGSGKTLDQGLKKKYRPLALPDSDGFAPVKDPNVPADFTPPSLDDLNNFPATQADASPTTSALDQAAGPLLALNANLKDPTAAIDKAMDTAAAKGPAIQEAFEKDPSAADALSSNLNADTGDSVGNILQTFLNDIGLLDDFQSDFRSAAQEFVSAGGSLAGSGLDASDFDAIGIGFSADGFSIGGETFTVPGSDAVGDGDTTPDTVPDVVQQEESGASDDSIGLVGGATVGNPVFSSGSFQPDVKIYNASGTTYVNVKQPEGEQDIGLIIARFPGHVFNGSGQTVLGTGQTNAPAKANGTLGVVQDTSADVIDGNLPPTWGGTTFSGLTKLWTGHLMDGPSVKVAEFQVFQDANYTYVVTNYEMDEAFELTTSGHTTRLQTTYLSLPTSANAEIYMESRGDDSNPGQTADRVDAINASAPGAFPAF
jgi:hypothetical protein